jgi:hypothetical protein
LGRDSRSGERIIWTGQPRVAEAGPLLRALALLLLASAVISTAFAIVIALALKISPTATLLFAAWTSALALGCWQGPKLWLSRVRYVVTESQVIAERGPLRRTIERKSISFARILWHPRERDVGDIELVRAVPTGALRRRLTVKLSGLSAPTRVLAIIRGTEDVTPAAGDDRPLAQRLETGERVVWAARPKERLRAWLPQGGREWMLLALGCFLIAVLARMIVRFVPNLSALVAAGLRPGSAPFIALVVGVGLTMALLAVIAGALVYTAVIQPARLTRETRYLVTNRRVLIQRGREELHLGRDKIVDVIDTPAGVGGVRDVFLVLDGPRARALAASGAFGEHPRGPELRPVLESVEDADSVSRILRQPSEPELPRAA